MPPILVFALAAVVLFAGGIFAIRASGARPGMARRLAGAREVRVGDLLDTQLPPNRPVRVAGRIRCPDPIVTETDDRLVAFHRDVQVKPPGGPWRTIERIREARGFELWDHDGSLGMDPALAAEPLVVIPHVWRGSSRELTNDAYRSALARLGADGAAWPARSVTRMVSVVERLLVLASVQHVEAGVVLAPPPGGYVISGLELDDAMRLLGGHRQWLLLGGYAAIAMGALVAVAGVVWAALG
jgi:hypothetical protein